MSLETSGALPIERIDPRVIRILDIKTPASGEEHRNLWQNLECLTKRDQVKFVLCDRDDYDWALEVLDRHCVASRCEVLFSPAVPRLAARDLADWIVADRLPVRFQLQLHKILWGDAPGR